MMRRDDPKQVEQPVRELRRRISEYRDYIEGDETRTRVVLVDPLLRDLGWNPEDPEAVQVEFKLTAGKPDYALMKDGKVVAVIEAKRLGLNLGSSVHLQVIRYIQDPACSQIDLVAFTNGDEWVFCRRSENWEAARVTISDDNSFLTAYGLVDNLSASMFDPPLPPNESRLVSKVVMTVQSAATFLPEADWKKKPALIRFVDGSEQEVTSWAKVYFEAARFVLDNGLVKTEDYPVVLARAKQVKKCAMNTSPVHPHGRPFGDPKEVRKGIWLEGETGSNKANRDYSVRMLESFGVNPATVQIEYATVTVDSSKPPPLPLRSTR